MSVGKYNIQKKRELYSFLKEKGYSFARMGKHEIWRNDTLSHSVSIPAGDSTNVNPIVASRLVKEVLSKAGEVLK